MGVKATSLRIYRDAQTEYVWLEWAFGTANLDKFEVQAGYSKNGSKWYWESPTSVSYSQGASNVYRYRYKPPSYDRAEFVKFSVLPFSKTYQIEETVWKNGKEQTQNKTVNYWEGEKVESGSEVTPECYDQGHIWQRKPATVPTLEAAQVELHENTVHVHVTDETTTTEQLVLVARIDGRPQTAFYTWKRKVNVYYNQQGWDKEYEFEMGAGHTYQLAAFTRQPSLDPDVAVSKRPGVASDLSEWSDVFTAKPARPTEFAVKKNGPDSVLCTWKPQGFTGDGYEVQYSDYTALNAKGKMDNAWNVGAYDKISTLKIDGNADHATVAGLETGKKWYFRVLRKNDSGTAWAGYVGSDGVTYATLSEMLPAAPKTKLAVPKLQKAQVQEGLIVLIWTDTLEAGASYVVEHSAMKKAWELNAQVDEQETDGDYQGRTGSYRKMAWPDGLDKGVVHYFKVKKVLGEDSVYATYSSDGIISATIPQTRENLQKPTNLAATERNGLRLSWSGNALLSGESFQVQYTSNPYAFEDNALDDIEEASLEESAGTSHVLTLTEVEHGVTWYARVRRMAQDAVSQWAGPVECAIAPDKSTSENLGAPTASSTNMSYAQGDAIVFAWVHNSEEGSAQSAYQLVLEVLERGGWENLETYSGTTDTAKAVSVSSLQVADGARIRWAVRTQGLYPGYWSPWSRTQVFDVYSAPVAMVELDTLDGDSVTMEEPLHSLPLRFHVFAGASGGSSETNMPIECAIQVAAAQAHDATAPDGSAVHIAEGQTIWSATFGSELFVPGHGWRVTAGPDELALVPYVAYQVSATVVTAQGMRAEAAPVYFQADWDGTVPQPVATVTFSDYSYTATVIPRCEVGGDNDQPELAEGVELSVYRVEFDGSTVLVADRLANDGQSGVEDPHAAFGKSTYRVVATDTATGAKAYGDFSARNEVDRIVVQWDESTVGGLFPIGYEANRLELDRNVTWQHGFDREMALRKYQGQQDPVAHFGTGRGHTMHLTAGLLADFDDVQREMLRKLTAYRGEVYVREPSGVGYWAVVKVGISGSNARMVQPVTLDVTRVTAPSGGAA